MIAALLVGLGTAFAYYVAAVLLAAAWALLATGLRRLTYRWPWLYRFATRKQQCALALLKALDILGCTIWLSPLYIVGLADRPTGRRMISSYVGMAAANKHFWAIALEGIIDAGAQLFGDRPAHCARAYRHYRGLDQ